MHRLRPPFLWAAVTAVTLVVSGGALPISPVSAAAPAVVSEVSAAVVESSVVGNLSVELRPVQAGEVHPDHNPGVLAARARAEREPLRDPALAFEVDDPAAADDATSGRSSSDTSSSDSPPSDNSSSDNSSSDRSSSDGESTSKARPSDVREHAAQVLTSLPGGDAVEIAWNHPDIGNHLGGVRLDAPTVMMLNAHRFEAEPERVEATVKHEIAHYYHGAVIANNADGDWWSGYWQLDAALQPVFGSQWMERSADCVALHLGADWTHYTSDCSGKAKKKAVEALVAGRMP